MVPARPLRGDPRVLSHHTPSHPLPTHLLGGERSLSVLRCPSSTHCHPLVPGRLVLKAARGRPRIRTAHAADPPHTPLTHPGALYTPSFPLQQTGWGWGVVVVGTRVEYIQHKTSDLFRGILPTHPVLHPFIRPYICSRFAWGVALNYERN